MFAPISKDPWLTGLSQENRFFVRFTIFSSILIPVVLLEEEKGKLKLILSKSLKIKFTLPLKRVRSLLWMKSVSE